MTCEEVDSDREGKNDPAPSRSALVQENEYERRPESAEYRDQANDQTKQHSRRHDIAQSFCTKETREGVALHSLKDVVLSCVEHFGIIAAFALDVVGDVVEDALGKDDFALGAREEEGVENFLGGGADVSTGDGVVRAVVAVGLEGG